MQTCLHSVCTVLFKGLNYSIKITTYLLSTQKLSGDYQLNNDGAMGLC